MSRGGAKIWRMAVLKSYQAIGVGRNLLKRAIESAKRKRARRLYLHVQASAVGFYEAAGFLAVSAVFDEAGIPHRKMIWAKQSPTR